MGWSWCGPEGGSQKKIVAVRRNAPRRHNIPRNLGRPGRSWWADPEARFIGGAWRWWRLRARRGGSATGSAALIQSLGDAADPRCFAHPRDPLERRPIRQVRPIRRRRRRDAAEHGHDQRRDRRGGATVAHRRPLHYAAHHLNGRGARPRSGAATVARCIRRRATAVAHRHRCGAGTAVAGRRRRPRGAKTGVWRRCRRRRSAVHGPINRRSAPTGYPEDLSRCSTIHREPLLLLRLRRCCARSRGEPIDLRHCGAVHREPPPLLPRRRCGRRPHVRVSVPAWARRGRGASPPLQLQ